MQKNNRPIPNLKRKEYNYTSEAYDLSIGYWIIIGLIILIIITSIFLVAGTPNSNFPNNLYSI